MEIISIHSKLRHRPPSPRAKSRNHHRGHQVLEEIERVLRIKPIIPKIGGCRSGLHCQTSIPVAESPSSQQTIDVGDQVLKRLRKSARSNP
ncbi:hypothetical protein NL676_030399 [Syzygium grande]|nr:hypothetical protein NL676_030399 [Syzygium grande]